MLAGLSKRDDDSEYVVFIQEKDMGVWAEKDDERRTRIGVFLRKTSLDRLQLLFSVLGGEMIFVGPMSERPASWRN